MIDVLDRTLRRSQNAVSDVHPSIDRLLATPVRYYAVSWIKVASVIGSIRYDAPIDPMQIYHVDPSQIDRSVTWTCITANKKENEHPRFRPPNYRLAGRVFDGDWDTVEASVTDSTIYQSFTAHFKEGVPWEETRFYERTLAVIEEGGSMWNCTSGSDLDERCEYLDELYDRIATEGYKTQDALYEDGDPTPQPYRIFQVLWDEIVVNIGRDGGWVFQDGRNRLAIARILGLEEVPVAVLVRHEEWQRKRDRIARGELCKSDISVDLRTHPDLVDLFRVPK